MLTGRAKAYSSSFSQTMLDSGACLKAHCEQV